MSKILQAEMTNTSVQSRENRPVNAGHEAIRRPEFGKSALVENITFPNPEELAPRCSRAGGRLSGGHRLVKEFRRIEGRLDQP